MHLKITYFLPQMMKMRDLNLDEIIKERKSRFHDEERYHADEKNVGGDSISLGEREISRSVLLNKIHHFHCQMCEDLIIHFPKSMETEVFLKQNNHHNNHHSYPQLSLQLSQLMMLDHQIIQ